MKEKDGKNTVKLFLVFSAVLLVSSLATAAVTNIENFSGDPSVEIGQSSVTQSIFYNVTIDGSSSSEEVVLNVSDAPDSGNISFSNTTIFNGPSSEVSVSNGTITGGTGNITISDTTQEGTSHEVRLETVLEHDTSGLDSTSSATYNLTDSDDNYATLTTDFTDSSPPSSVTVDAPSSVKVRGLSENFSVNYSYSDASPTTTEMKFVDSSGNVDASYSINDTGYSGDNSEKKVVLDLDNPDTGSFTSGEQYKIRLTVTDDAGNSQTITTQDNLLEIDGTPPSVTDVEVTGNKTLRVDFSESVWAETGRTGQLTASEFSYIDNSGDGASSISSVQHGAGDAAATLVLNSDLKNSDLGSDQIEAQNIFDGSGNELTSETASINDDTSDDVAPSITRFVAEESGSDVNITLTSDEKLSSITASIDGTSLDETDFSTDETSAPYNYTYLYTPGSDGQYTVTLSSVGDGSNTVSLTKTSTAVVDTTGPSVGDMNPAATNETKPVLNFTSVQDNLNAVDGSSVSVTIENSTGSTFYSQDTSVDDLTYYSSTNSVLLNLSKQDSSMDAGNYTVYISLSDDDETPNSKTFSFTLTVDFEDPTIDKVKIKDGENNDGIVNSGETVNVYVNASDNNAVSSVEVDASEFNAGTVELNSGSTSDYRGSFTVGTVTKDGSNKQVTATAFDNAGNTGTGTSNSLTIDTSPPTILEQASIRIVDDSGTQGELNQGDKFAISVNASDSLSGVGNVSADLSAVGLGNQASLTQYSSTNKYNATFTVQSGDLSSFAPTVTVEDTTGNSVQSTPANGIPVSAEPPQITSAETVDSNHNARIDHYRVKFSEAVDDSTFDSSNWYVSGRTVQGIDTGFSDSADDSIIYLEFSESGSYDTGATPDLTASGIDLSDLEGNNIADIGSGDVNEKDEADPVVEFGDGFSYVSFPTTSGPYDISNITNTSGSRNTDNIQSIWRYINGEWQSYEPGRAESFNDFNNIRGGYGYVIEASSSGRIVADIDESWSMDGRSSPPGVTIEKSEWNLVGHYKESTQSLSSTELGISEVDHVLGETSSDSTDSVSKLRPGNAYWVSIIPSYDGENPNYKPN